MESYLKPIFINGGNGSASLSPRPPTLYSIIGTYFPLITVPIFWPLGLLATARSAIVHVV
jgi:hypothetical protein